MFTSLQVLCFVILPSLTQNRFVDRFFNKCAKHSEEQLLYITCGFHAFVLFRRFYALTLLEILQ